MEKKVVENADIVVSNTDFLKDEFIARFPWLQKNKFVVLLNGFDPDDIQMSTLKRREPDKFIIIHAGFLYGKRDPRSFLEAIAMLIQSQRIDRQKIRLWLVGSVELPYDLAGYVDASGLQEVVRLITHVPYQESLQYLASADALVLLQPGTTTQVPSKLFEYIALNKPILAISPSDGATSRLVHENSLGIFAEADNVDQIASAIEQLYRQWHLGPGGWPINGRARDKFDVKKVTELLSRKFEELANRSTA
jgi:glycosyltransferase involved in cell wall biosynthesis